MRPQSQITASPRFSCRSRCTGSFRWQRSQRASRTGPMTANRPA
jgi:hypothetical protein